MSSHYSFPLQSDKEIAEFLQDLSFPFRPEWKKPTEAIAKELFQQIVVLVTSVDKDRVSQLNRDVAEIYHIQAEAYAKGLTEAGILLMTFRVMESIGIHNFSLLDIISPTWPRIRIILSAFINFIRFQHEFFIRFEEAGLRTVEMEDAYNALLSLYKQDIKQRQQLETSEEMIYLKKLKDEVAQLEDAVIQAQKERLQQETKTQTSAVALKNLVSELDVTQTELDQSKHTLEVLKTKDITGLLADVQQLKLKASSYDHNIDTLQNNIRIARAKIENTNNLLYNFEVSLSDFKDGENSARLAEQVENKIDVIQGEYDRMKDDITSLKKQKDSLSIELNTLNEQISIFKKKYDDEISKYKTNIQRMTEEKLLLEQKDKENILAIEQKKHDIKRSEDELKACLQTHTTLLNAAIKRMKLIEEQLDLYHKRLIQSMNSP